MNKDARSTRPYRMTTRREAVERTRERIMQAAFELWRVQPYDDVTVDDVAALAEVSRQTVHRQFGSKDDLFAAVVDWMSPREDARSRQPEPGDVVTAVTMLVDRYEEFGDAIVRFLDLEGRVEAVDGLLQAGRQGHRAEIEHAFGPWLDALTGAERDRAVLALYAATDVMVWKLLRRDFGRSRQDVDTIIRTLVEGVLTGIPTASGNPSRKDAP
jgi:AcrR family transcriptional regulator